MLAILKTKEKTDLDLPFKFLKERERGSSPDGQTQVSCGCEGYHLPDPQMNLLLAVVGLNTRSPQR